MPALPPDVAELRAKLCVPDFDERLDAAAAFAGLPRLGAFPRPGQASAWRLREWEGWAKANGFLRGERGKFGDNFYHPAYRTLSFDLSADSHPDPRGSMRVATELRRAYIDLAGTIVEGLMFLIDGWASESVETPHDGPPTAAALATWLRATIERPGNLMEIRKLLAVDPNRERVDCSGDIREMVAVLRKEFGLTPKRSFELVGFSTVSAEKLATIDKQGIPYSVEQPDALLKKLLELRDAKRQEDEVAREQREARQREREAKQTPAPAPSAPPVVQPAPPDVRRASEAHQAKANEARDRVAREIEGAAEVVKAAHQRLQRAAAAIEAMQFAEIPPEVASAVEEAARLREENAQVLADHRHLLSEYAAVKADNETMTTLLDEAAAAPNEWWVAFSQLAQFVSENLADNDIMKLMVGIEKVRAAATNAVAHAAKSSQAQPQSSTVEAATS